MSYNCWGENIASALFWSKWTPPTNGSERNLAAAFVRPGEAVGSPGETLINCDLSESVNTWVTGRG